VKYCNLIGAATVVAARTSSVYGCDQTLFTASTANNHQKASGIKKVSNIRPPASQPAIRPRSTSAMVPDFSPKNSNRI